VPSQVPMADAPSRAGLYNNDRRLLMVKMMTLPSAGEVKLARHQFR
jgi:hypothetical protein